VYPGTNKKPQTSEEGGLGVAVGLSGGVDIEQTYPLYTYPNLRSVYTGISRKLSFISQNVNNITVHTMTSVSETANSASESLSQALTGLQSALQQLGSSLSRLK
jgi:hypothetical protein